MLQYIILTSEKNIVSVYYVGQSLYQLLMKSPDAKKSKKKVRLPYKPAYKWLS